MLFDSRLFASIHDIDDTSEACPLQFGTDDDTPCLFADGFITTVLSKSPDSSQIDDVPRCATAYGLGSLAADDNTTTASGCSNQASRIADKVSLGGRISQQRLTVRDFEANATLHGFRDGFEFEVIAQALSEVEGDQVAVSGTTGMLESLLVDRSQSENVVVVRQGTQTVVGS